MSGMYKTIILNNVVSAESFTLSDDPSVETNYLLESVDTGAVPANVVTTPHVAQYGEEKTNVSLQKRQIEIIGYIVAPAETEIRTLKQALNRFIVPFEDITMELFEDSQITFTPDSSVAYSITYTENNELMSKFKITGVASNPLFEDLAETVVSTPPAGGSTNEREANNTGDVPCWYELVATPGSVAITNPIFNLIVGGVTVAYMQLELTVAVGETLKISSKYGNEYAKVISSGGAETDVFVKMSRASEVFYLPKGVSKVALVCNGTAYTTMSYSLKYKKLYLEVE